MARTEVIKFRDFMDGTWKVPEKNRGNMKKAAGSLVKAGTIVPLALTTAAHASAAESVKTTASAVIAGTTLQILAHALDPVAQILVALSLPIASIVMIGGCYFFLFGNSDKAWSTIQNAGLGYILIQLSPLFIRVLEQVGKSI
ncbi:hypothetical protein [Brevibacillus borstelensis]|uniref:hypothetical protein n=1 Tax=Brevibacillus borstelensis TaxID=45462 RepID=UPI0004F262C3|nr:hypothetical protein [Brevibacillus borstelensis]KKX54195.1 hypothetical protein X546_17755 [Brevibacillus borstelensis cifa_chp40]WNF07292.1 hypothetical protein RFB14_07640 [Brevibacillus borstelensis]